MYVNLLKAWIKRKNYLYEVFLKGKKVIDLGCGEGEILTMDPKNIIGVDINKGALMRLKEKGLQVIESSITNIPIPEESFDVVLCSNLIEHLFPEEAYKMLQESQRILRQDGKIIIITPTEKTVWNSFGHTKPYTIASIMKLFRKNTYESFEPLAPMKEEFRLYYGTWSKNKITFLISTIFANIFTSFAGSYLLVLKKYE